MLSIASIATASILGRRKVNSHRSKRRLWNEAAALLGPESQSAEIDFLALAKAPFQADSVQAAVQSKLDECLQKRWHYKKSNGQIVFVRDVLTKISGWLNKFKEIGDAAVQYDPAHASLPWAAIRLLLQATVNDVEVYGSMVEGLELTSRIIVRYAEVEKLCLRGSSRLKTQLANALINLYAAVLRYLAKASDYFSQNTARRALKSAFSAGQKGVVDYFRRISAAEEDAMIVVSLVQAEDQRNRLIALTSAVSSLQKNLSSPKVSTEEQREKLHKWIAPISTRATFQNSLGLRHTGTCDWILDRAEYKEWSSATNNIGKSKLLWIHGGPGFGKTILCSRIIEKLITQEARPVVYFFCISANEAEREPFAILRSWISQLIKANEDAAKLIYPIYQSNFDSSATPEELWKIFNMLARTIHCTFVIDGFDECTAINKASKFHTTDGRTVFLQSLIGNIRDTLAQVLLVSRDIDDIRAAFGTLRENTSPVLFEYSITPQDTQPDINSWSKAFVDEDLGNKSDAFRNEIAKAAAQKSDGMFLWLHLLRKELDPAENAKTLRRTVSEMPPGIDQAYERDLDRLLSLKGDKRERALAILRWITFAVRPLTVRELVEAIALSNDDTEDSYPADDLPDTWQSGDVDDDYVNNIIRRSCGSLVELRRQNEDDPLGIQTVHFVHFSVKEFLLRSGTSSFASEPKLQSICFPNGASEHDQLARLCLQYLCYDVFGEPKQHKSQEKIDIYPFLQYAARSWYSHAKHKDRFSQDIIHYAEKLFSPATSNWIIWSQIFESDDILELSSDNDSSVKSDTSLQPLDSSNPMYYAAILGLVDVIKALGAQGLNPNTGSRKYGSPLQAAVYKDHQEAAECLIALGADVSQRGGMFGSPIGAAIANGSLPMFIYLKEAGADLEVLDTSNRTLLHIACSAGAVDIVKLLLLNHTGVVNRKSSLGETPLVEAMKSRNATLIKLLLDSGADKNAVDRHGRPVLLRATDCDAIEVVNLLLQRKADVNAATSIGFTSLHEASYIGSEAIIRSLLAAGADIDACDKDGWTALHYSLFSTQSSTATLLLENHADFKKCSNEGWSALHIAAEHGDEHSVRELIRRGADVQAENAASVSVLHSAVQKKRFNVAKILLENGAEVWTSSIDGNVPFDLAFASSNQEFIQLLLDHGALLDEKLASTFNHLPNETKGSSLALRLQKLIFQKDEDTVVSLTRDDRDSTVNEAANSALLAAMTFGTESLVKHLLDVGADIDTKTANRRTSLHIAAIRASLPLVQLLVDHNVNTHIRDANGSEPLDLAIHGGFVDLAAVKLLINHSGLLRETDKRGIVSKETCAIFAGQWSGFYTYFSWNKDEKGETSMNVVMLDDRADESLPCLWTAESSDLGGTKFKIFGELLPGNEIRFVKIYENKLGWRYAGVLDVVNKKITGNWGVNETIWHGAVELVKG